ncbi:hypothetical protein LCGC14_0336830 [marine sediment metagenome]|uniref:DNA 3'-5' helicase n=1 Tax=marine sediment metagenome TaxID=412755 RepID=A0A0F9WMJ9_9ZZZZ
MPQIARLIGGAGTGKTTESLRIMDGVLERVHDPHLIGFVSFTRAARREASSRAADRFGMKPQKLETEGWFKTHHAICYKQLGVGKELITDNAESKAWIRNNVDEDAAQVIDDSADMAEAFAGKATDADKALAIWGEARNRLEPLENAWGRAEATSERTPSYLDVEEIVQRYEQAKRLDGRVDFTDILARFSGWHLAVRGGAEKCEPDGEVPAVPCWFFDEAQDNSALTDAVARRLISHDDCEYAYVVGDFFQSIYGFGGASPHYFMGWDVSKERTMPKSYRCPPAILDVGEEILRDCTDYWDRGIQPADHEGVVDTAEMGRGIVADVDPAESWLLLARTNLLARKWGRLLDASGVPWTPTRGGGGWAAPRRNAAIRGLMAIQAGAPIDGAVWLDILKYVPSRFEGQETIVRGTKTDFAGCDADEAEDEWPFLLPDSLHEVGATKAFVVFARAGAWMQWIPKSREYVAAVGRWGEEAIQAANVRVGTIHSVKGSEADNVAVLTTLNEATVKGMRTDAGTDEELRVWYVAATRARRRLIWVRENTRYRKRVPA